MTIYHVRNDDKSPGVYCGAPHVPAEFTTSWMGGILLRCPERPHYRLCAACEEILLARSRS